MKRKFVANINIKLLIIISSAFIFRLILANFGTLWLDMNSWLGWSSRLITVGFKKFYESWCDYLPSYLYVLWGLGKIREFLVNLNIQIPTLIIYKLPSILADLGTAFLIFKISFEKKRFGRWPLILVVLYLFNPAIFANSTLWGQADSFFTFFLIWSFFLFEKENFLASSLTLCLSSFIKPLGFLLVPIFAYSLVKRRKINQLLFCGLIFIIIGFIQFVPFLPNRTNIFQFILQRFLVTINQYPYATLNAFNLWTLLRKNWVRDDLQFLFLNYQQLGSLIFVPIFGTLIFNINKKRQTNFDRSFYISLIFLTVFLFTTRIHERHLFPFFPFLLIAAGKYPAMILVYLLSSLFYVLNLYHVFILISKTSQQVLTPFLINIISLGNLIVFPVLILIKKFKVNNLKFLNNFIKSIIGKTVIPKDESVKIKKVNWLIMGILLFSFLIRIFRLEWPENHIFDEVYHAFTASEIAKANVKAWEWWNQAPEGFAYEWTHPPLAKLFMAGGILLFGDNSFGWRFPAVCFGTGIILLTFLITKHLFKNEKIAILAATILSFDGLLFVMSRIGMTDVYLLFFILATIFLGLKTNWFLATIFLGLSVATKWTGVYLLPVIGILIIANFLKTCRNSFSKWIKNLLLPFIGVIIIPILVYLSSYFLFFKSGHTLTQFWELQKQMWWYHTRLKATHNFQSPSYTWPFLIRPVWFWVKYEEEKIGNIYNLGNPTLWWTGILILPFVFIESVNNFLKRKDFRLIFIIFCYFIFWLPWVFSPRIMFLHHYLPALPFLSILLAYFLNKLQIGRKGKNLTISIFLIVLAITFFFFYPIYTGILIPKNLVKYFFWLSSWR